MQVIQIVPQLPPSINGLGDYALNLARQLRKQYNIETRFIVGDRNWQGATEIEDFPIQQVTADSAEALFSILSFDKNQSVSVLLHYVGYGYAERGCPVWLVKGLKRWKANSADSCLVTMFHEVYAYGYPIWTSSFWLSPLQKQLAEHLVNMSDRCITSKQSYAEILYKMSRNKTQITHLPVFSNIGEPECNPPIIERTRRLVLFGHKNSKLQVYQQGRQALELACKTLDIKEIYDIGTPTGLQISEINGIVVMETGVIKTVEISKIMLDSIAGFLNFPPPAYLAKSTIFAAFCAHRLIPCMVTHNAMLTDGLQSGKHYWSASDKNSQLSLELGQVIANNAYTWYQTHNLSAQAKIFINHLNYSNSIIMKN
ncbi:glycosyltransferase family 1 protein [Komarekiella sp. 'clone 1']|uniref:Glycosyltransferase family 1 protein n=1 Tax=Komarekiella delphini-convector SJRDD-AB1 TaxID=2593771 RepID=A0AA40VSE9_9NOST|nr:glycosyltransferase family 1 protein [Komarekiella delphini-convector SJRDD-AB1]